MSLTTRGIGTVIDLYSDLSLEDSQKLSREMDSYCGDIGASVIARLEDACMSKQKSFKMVVASRKILARLHDFLDLPPSTTAPSDDFVPYGMSPWENDHPE